MKRFFQFIWTQIKRVPWYGWLAGIACIGISAGLYNLAKPIITAWSHSWRVEPIIVGLDTKIPLVPYFFVEIYFCYFALAFFGPVVCSVTQKEHFLTTVISILVCEIIVFLLWSCCPSYMDRNHVAGVPIDGYGSLIEAVKDKKGLSYFLMKVLLRTDGGADNYNLFPSFHCGLITFCYLGVMNRKELKIGSRIFWLVMAILVCLSTNFTKQHYFFDLVTGVLLSVLVFGIFKWINPGKHILKKCPNFLIIEKLNWTHEKITKKSFKSGK
ncbi:MAG: phosphatase PAP2 family protein [Mycoplasma sp.]|nr:phosphatase PAP2 family protein [Candidatus Hennigella equi]